MAKTDDEIREIITDYETDRERAMRRRDERLREALDSGRIQADLIRITGLSREAMRQALNPDAREAARRARAERQAAKAPSE